MLLLNYVYIMCIKMFRTLTRMQLNRLKQNITTFIFKIVGLIFTIVFTRKSFRLTIKCRPSNEN